MGLFPNPWLPEEERPEPIHITGDIYFQNRIASWGWLAGVVLLVVPPAGVFLLAFYASLCVVTNQE